MKRELQSQFHKIKMIERRKDDSAASPEAKRKKKSKMKNKRRFSDEQIRSLESIFESESTKLEPRKKMQVATELGLQPRQVAIWFQNKRARWKSKQIEHDYAQLRANYDSLASGFESLIKEKESLLLELQMLNEQLGKSDDEINGVGKDLKRSDWSSSNRGNNNDNNDNNKSVDDFIASSEKWFNEDSGGLLDPSTSSSPQSHWLNFWV